MIVAGFFDGNTAIALLGVDPLALYATLAIALVLLVARAWRKAALRKRSLWDWSDEQITRLWNDIQIAGKDDEAERDA